jgi:D-aminoacyl-tRNA deacylase
LKVVLQRVKRAQVTVDERITGAILQGLLLLVGFTQEDREEDLQFLAAKIAHLRIFADTQGKMNQSLLDVKGQILSVPQFTLYGDCLKGRRPHFVAAAKPDQAEPLYHFFNDLLRSHGLQVETGVFGANMEISLINDGPITFILESKKEKK